jgi:transcriptional regulator with XRE-family HTH domain
MSQGPTVRRLQLGRELKRLRERADVTRDQVAALLECDLTKISKFETGRLGISLSEVKLLMPLYRVGGDEAERVLELAREAKKRSALRVPDFVRALVGLEAEAVEIKTFEVELVPGLLQTEPYTRDVTRAADPTRDPTEVDRLVALRRERQERLTGSNPPQLWAVINEAVIHRQVGGRTVMRQQLESLLAMAELPTVSVQILPFSAGSHAAMGTSFSIFRLSEPPDTAVAYTEDLWSAEYLDRDVQVNAYVQVFDRLSQAALDAEGTANMLKEAIGGLR